MSKSRPVLTEKHYHFIVLQEWYYAMYAGVNIVMREIRFIPNTSTLRVVEQMWAYPVDGSEPFLYYKTDTDNQAIFQPPMIKDRDWAEQLLVRHPDMPKILKRQRALERGIVLKEDEEESTPPDGASE